MDPETQRMIEDLQNDLRELILVMRNLGNTMSALGDIEIDAFGKSVKRGSQQAKVFSQDLDQSGKQVKQFTGLVDASGEAIRSETAAREKSAEAAQASALEERRRKTEEFVYRRTQRSAFRDLTAELSTTRGATARLQESVFKQVEGNTLLQGGILLVEGALRGLGQAATSMARDLYAGQRGAAVSAKALNHFASTVGEVAQGVGLGLAGMSLLGLLTPSIRLFGVTIKLAQKGLAALAGVLGLTGIALKTFGDLNERAAEQNDRLFRTYNDLNRASIGVIGGLDGLLDTAQLAGVSVAELEAFANQIASNARMLVFLGNTTGQAMRQFAEVSGGLRKSELGRELELLGITSEEQRESVLSYMALQARLGRLENRSTANLIKSSAEYAKQLDLLAQLTGTTAKEQRDIRERQLAEERYRSALVAARARGDQAEIDRLERAGQLAAAMEAAGSPTTATGILQIAAAQGALTTPEAVAAEMTVGVNAILNSQTTVTDALQQMLATGRINQQQMADINRLIGTIPGFQVPVVELANVIDRIGPALEESSRTGESVESILKREAELRKQGDKSLQLNVDAARNQQNAALLMDRILTTYNASAQLNASASSAFAQAVKLFADTVGAGGVTGGLVGQGGGPPAPYRDRPAFRGTGAERQGTDISDAYINRVAQLESGGRNIGNQPRAGQTATSAFGLYQITEDTFKGIVANAPPGSPLKGKTFEDMKKDVNLQTEAMTQLTDSNARLLARRGLSTSDAAKYMAHMLGYSTAARVLEAPTSASLGKLIPQDWLEKNNLQHFRTAGELRRHFDDITGGQGYRFGGISQGPRDGYLQKLHGVEAVVPLPDGKSIPVALSGPLDRMGGLLTNLENSSQRTIDTLSGPLDRMGGLLTNLENSTKRSVDMMSAQLSRLDEVVAVMRNQLGVSQRILQVTQN